MLLSQDHLWRGKKVFSFILAGGEGKRLLPLTEHRAKPAVPFGGRYRMIDVVLSNFVNSGLYKIVVLTQYRSDSLQRHIRKNWNLASVIGQYVETVPAQMRVGRDWYKGSAHAVFQNLYLLDVELKEKPDYVAVAFDTLMQVFGKRVIVFGGPGDLCVNIG